MPRGFSGTMAAAAKKTAMPHSEERVIAGLDPALRCSGYGVIRVSGTRMQAIDCGVIRNPKSAPLSECLRRASGGIREMIQAHTPEIAAVEGSFYYKNARTAMVLGMVRGAMVGVLAEHNIICYEYAPRRVKQVIVGNGRANKEQVATFIANVLNLDVQDIPRDATDAMAIAVCHAFMLSSSGGVYLPDPI